jgi:hypothetical protein
VNPISSRRLLTVIGFALYLVLSGCAPAKSESLRQKITAALTAEIPQARLHFGAHTLAPNINATFLINDTVLKVAEVVVAQTKQDRLYGSFGISPNGDEGISVSSLPLEEGGWHQALAKFQNATFDKVAEHYSAQVVDIPSIIGFIHVYLGIEKNGDIAAAIGISEEIGEKQRLPPRQFAQIPRNSSSTNDLPAKRCDVDTQGELVLPGEGYLLNVDEIARSEKYWASLSPQTAAVTRQVIKNDHSPWLVSEKHIAKFDIDRSEARKRAVEMWNTELQAANDRLRSSKAP